MALASKLPQSSKAMALISSGATPGHRKLWAVLHEGCAAARHVCLVWELRVLQHTSYHIVSVPGQAPHPLTPLVSQWLLTDPPCSAVSQANALQVRDAQGRKMSKSLGNVVDPVETIQEYGSDALRFTLATGKFI